MYESPDRPAAIQVSDAALIIEQRRTYRSRAPAMERSSRGVRAVAAVTAILLALGVISHGDRPAVAQTSASSAAVLAQPAIDPQEQLLLDMINAYRRSAGLPDLQLSMALEEAARWKVAAIAASGMGAFAHDDIEREWPQRLIDFGYPPDLLVGENLGALEGVSLEGLMETWKASSLHNGNLLGETWQYIGIASAAGADGVQYWVLTFGEVPGAPPN